MTNIKTKSGNDLTPATLHDIPIGQKITAYEDILNDQELYSKKLEELAKKGNEVLEPAGITFSDYLQRDAIKVTKKRNVNPIINSFAERIGNDISDVLANGSTGETTLEQYLGEESYAKLKVIADEYATQKYKSKEVDEKESEKVWLNFTKVRDQYQEAREALANANRRMDQANQYVSYVQKLAEVASKTKRLMQ